LVTKKNRKVRRLRELYPDVRCKIFYQRDYLTLLVKYGLEAPGTLAEGSAPPEGVSVLDLSLEAGSDLPALRGDGRPDRPNTRRHAKPRAS
jgi:hypothetical protein